MAISQDFGGISERDARCEDVNTSQFDCGNLLLPALPPHGFQQGVQSVYAALVVGTALLHQSNVDLRALFEINGTKVVMDFGEEIAKAREWCAALVAALSVIEDKVLEAATLVPFLSGQCRSGCA